MKNRILKTIFAISVCTVMVSGCASGEMSNMDHDTTDLEETEVQEEMYEEGSVEDELGEDNTELGQSIAGEENEDAEKGVEESYSIEYNDDDIVKVLYPIVYIYGEQYYADKINPGVILHHDYDSAKEISESVYSYLYEYAIFGDDKENEAEPEMVVTYDIDKMSVPKEIMEMYYNVLYYDKTELPPFEDVTGGYYIYDEVTNSFKMGMGDAYGEEIYTIDSITPSEDGTELTVEFSDDDMFFEEKLGSGKGTAVLVYNRNPLALELGYKFSIKSFEYNYEENK